MQPTPNHAVEAVRHWQTHAPVVSDFFYDAYALLDWLAQVLPGTTPPVVLRISKIRGARMAEYSPADGAMLPTITLDPTKSTDGYVAAEWLAHELLHHWQWSYHEDRDPRELHENVHDEEILNMLMDWGLSVEPGTGLHRGYVGDVWRETMDHFIISTGIDLGRHKLPGPQGDQRKLHKWQCPAGDCGFSFRSRRKDLKVMCVGMGDDTHSPAFMGMIE